MSGNAYKYNFDKAALADLFARYVAHQRSFISMYYAMTGLVYRIAHLFTKTLRIFLNVNSGKASFPTSWLGFSKEAVTFLNKKI